MRGWVALEPRREAQTSQTSLILNGKGQSHFKDSGSEGMEAREACRNHLAYIIYSFRFSSFKGFLLIRHQIVSVEVLDCVGFLAVTLVGDSLLLTAMRLGVSLFNTSHLHDGYIDFLRFYYGSIKTQVWGNQNRLLLRLTVKSVAQLRVNVFCNC